MFLLGITHTIASQVIKPRTTDYYLNTAAAIELQELIEAKVIIDSTTIAPKYLDSDTQYLNKKGSKKLLDIRIKVLSTYFNDYLYLQHVIYKKDVYALFFSLAGFDDMSWDIIKFPIEKWQAYERLSDFYGYDNKAFKHILGNYDEGPKNDKDVRLFVIKDYLVMERDSLYHSLYDLNTGTVIINEVSPWHEASPKNEEELDEWIRVNLHDKIKNMIQQERD